MHTKLPQVSIFVLRRVTKYTDQSNICKYTRFFKRKQAFQAESPSGVGAGITAIAFKHQFINNLQKLF